MRNNFLVFGQPLIEIDEINEVIDSLKKAWLGTGPKVHKFEMDFAKYKDIRYSAAVYSCTAGLHLSCLALGIKSGDEVITSAMTFAATVNAIVNAGAVPVIADIDPITLNIDPVELEKKITSKTKAIIPVHFAGRLCEMDTIMDISKNNKLHVIEDCAHAIETEYNDKKSGTFGDLGVFSFYATKNLTTGEGGMIIGNDEEIISRIKKIALHGLSKDAWTRFSDSGYKHYFVENVGFKYNMMDLQAAIGIHQLKRIENNLVRRNKIWESYNNLLKDFPITLPTKTASNSKHARHLYTIRINKERCGISRDKFLEEMTKRKIGIGVHYLAIPEHPFYRKEYGLNPNDYPHATRYGRETVSLPISPKITDQDIDDVIQAITETLKSVK
ncbi:MAG: DegT/DnrJ/EryC1/StrS family aminotransferase [Bacteroidetes bacterium]|nr:DegT/DnrJ/EryC1/StrS family aminotransferase [Bacteroidota bacterium]